MLTQTFIELEPEGFVNSYIWQLKAYSLVIIAKSMSFHEIIHFGEISTNMCAIFLQWSLEKGLLSILTL